MMKTFCASVVLLCAAASAPSAADAPTLRDGYVFVGGHYETVNGRTAAVGQMFVEYHRPATITQPYPVVMVHGSAQTGVNFLGTPDGRPGWAQRFVEKGFAVYVVDQVGRGRSGDNPEAYGPYTRLQPSDLEDLYTGQETRNLFPQARLHTQWPGGPGVRGNPAFDQFFASQVPYLASAVKTEELVDPALADLLQTIGPAVLLTHSQAGVFGFAASDQHPDLVKAHVAVEPNGPPFFDIRFKGGADWWEKASDAPARAYGLTRVPLTFDPPIHTAGDLAIVQADRPTRADQIRCWLQREPARKLPNIAKVPTVIVTGEASFRATMDDCTSAFLEQAGARPDRLDLAAHDIHGNGHMMMLEANNIAVADAIIAWVEAHVAGKDDSKR
ncbi:alpha/beta hydrolase [Beijerinckia sp. L45]|uniref:alpha/beta hydrolase n=1 Tax=Beijerinckia sp. L45 TaxID=1641855 RepID=UPI00131A8A06|nr:alpha/beta hydrolase [Beijerinckia sp. L45]